MQSRSRSRTRSRSRSRRRSRSRSRIRSKSRSRTSLNSENVEFKLVDRAEHEVHFFWKYSIIVTLTIISILNIVLAYSFESFTNKDKSTCLLTTDLSSRLATTIYKANNWRDRKHCDYMILVPMVFTVFSGLWIQIFYMSGRGGYTVDHFHHLDSKPWRIVMPALVCFAIITLSEFGHAYLIFSYLETMCRNLRKWDNFMHGKGCEYLITNFIKADGVDFNVKYTLVVYNAICIPVLWLLLTLIMVARVLRAVDFRVIILTGSKESVKTNTETLLQPIDDVDTSKENMIYLNRRFMSSRSVRFK